MKKLVTPLLLVVAQLIFAQQAYYNDVNLSLTGQDLYFELQAKIDISNNTFNYGDVRDVVKITDEDPANNSNLLLVYGHNDTDGNCTTDRSRNKDDFGGTSCLYNREHVFARSRANPEMGTVSNSTIGIGADPHNLRPSDQQMNNNKGSKQFAAGSGTAGDVGSGNWYPGNEWKGDVARMMMYMYTRYGDRCLPSLIGVGATQGSTEMLQLFLNWNVEDPVSTLEDQRNPYLETEYGNRNPFIDNPYLATIIWGGPAAEDRWNLFSVEDFTSDNIVVYPNPASEKIRIQTTSADANQVLLYDLSGRKIFQKPFLSEEQYLDVSHLQAGMYLLEIKSLKGSQIKKISIK